MYDILYLIYCVIDSVLDIHRYIAISDREKRGVVAKQGLIGWKKERNCCVAGSVFQRATHPYPHGRRCDVRNSVRTDVIAESNFVSLLRVIY
jgi:hypothetical protein